MTTPEIEYIGKIIVNSAFKVHKELGPGLLEKVYEICLAHEISKEGIEVMRQLDIPIIYDGIAFKEGHTHPNFFKFRSLDGLKVLILLNSV